MNDSNAENNKNSNRNQFTCIVSAAVPATERVELTLTSSTATKRPKSERAYRSSTFLNDPRIDIGRSNAFVNELYETQVDLESSVIRNHFSDAQVIDRIAKAASIFKADERHDAKTGVKRRRGVTEYQVDHHFAISRDVVKQFIKNEETDKPHLHKIDKDEMIQNYMERVAYGLVQLPSITTSSSTVTSSSTSSSIASVSATCEQPSEVSTLTSTSSSSIVCKSDDRSVSVADTFVCSNQLDFNEDDEIKLCYDHDIDVTASADISRTPLQSAYIWSTQVDFIKQLNIPVAPSSIASLSSWLLMWRLQNKVSQAALDSLLHTLSQTFSFNASLAIASDTVHVASAATADGNETHFNPASFPISEQQLRRVLDLPSIDHLADSFSYTQCSYCGKLFSKQEFKTLVDSQLSSGVIEKEKEAFCDHPRCPQTPFYYERVIEENTSRGQNATGDRYMFVPPCLYRSLPLVVTQISSLIEWLKQCSETPGWCEMLDGWMDRPSSVDKDGVRYFGDIYDGEKWRTDPDLQKAAREKKNSPIMLSLNADGLNPHNRGNKSVYVVFITVLNLPRSKRHLAKNQLLYAVIPGVDNHKCSTAQLEQVLYKLVEELKILYQPPYLMLNGVPRVVKLFNIVCDQPATRDVAGFCGHSADQACMYCAASIFYHRRLDQFTSSSTIASTSTHISKTKSTSMSTDTTSSLSSSSSSTCAAASSSSSTSSSPCSTVQREIEFFQRNQLYVSDRLNRTHKNKSSSVERERVTPDMSEWKDISLIPCPYTAQLLRSSSDVKMKMKAYRSLSQKELPAAAAPDKTSSSGSSRSSASAFRLLTADEVKAMMNSHKKVFEECKTSHSSTGVRWTPFIELSYYDPISCCCVDVMHTVWLGVTKSVIECLIVLGSDGLDAVKLKKIQNWIKQTCVPHDIGKMQSKWSGSLGHFKSIEWADFITLFAICALVHVGISQVYLLPLIPLQRLSFLLRKYVLSETEIDEIELNIRLFSALVCYVCGPQVETINFHLLHHIPFLLRQYGPCCNWWCFVYERFNGILKQYPRNDANVSASMMRSWINHQQAIDKFIQLRRQAMETEKAIDQKYKHICQLDQQINLQATVSGTHSDSHQDLFALLEFKLEYEQYDFETSNHIACMPGYPSSLYYASKLSELSGGELIIDNDPLEDAPSPVRDSVANSSGVFRKVNSQGSHVGINYNMDFTSYLRLQDLCKGSEYLASGAEHIPCLPREKDAQIQRQIHHLDEQWSTNRKGNIRALKAPPYIEVLTSQLLNQFYDSRYPSSFCTIQRQVIKSSSFRGAIDLSLNGIDRALTSPVKGTVFLRCKSGDEIQCYRQMFLCGELYGSRWSHQDTGFISSLFEDKEQGASFPWYGQVCFFFSHILIFKDLETQKELPVKHHFAFVIWYSPAKSIVKDGQICASIKDWSYPQVTNTGSAAANAKGAKFSQVVTSNSASAAGSINSRPQDGVIDSQLESNMQVSVETKEIKNKVTSKKDELKAFMQSTDLNAKAFTTQIENIITDRLVQDFPLFQEGIADNDSNSSRSEMFNYTAILPLCRIWGRACKANAPKKNKIFINIPHKTHYS